MTNLDGNIVYGPGRRCPVCGLAYGIHEGQCSVGKTEREAEEQKAKEKEKTIQELRSKAVEILEHHFYNLYSECGLHPGSDLETELGEAVDAIVDLANRK